MPINILPSNLAAKIAAGEVVERPSSVVKELVENALDADATHITVDIDGGGVELIRVTDDGVGISGIDIELAIQRHATSKLITEGDLERIATMGFRGEALPSIAAVSRMMLSSRSRGSNEGRYLHVDDGVVTNKGIIGSAEGTTVSVRDLFYKLPARKKFLNSASAEVGRIHAVIIQLALAYPQVRFKLSVNEKEKFVSPGNNRFFDVLTAVYGSDVTDRMLEVCRLDKDGWSAWGYVSSYSLHRSNRRAINFYVNRRWVQNRILTQAVEGAYSGMLMVGRYPIVSLHLELPPHELDVNVHPTKREVRFYDQGFVFSFVRHAVREAVVKDSPIPPIAVTESKSPRFNVQLSRFDLKLDEPPSLERASMQKQSLELTDDSDQSIVRTLPTLRVLGQIASTYIVAEGPGGVYLLDQHAAHECIMYERLSTLARDRRMTTQGLLEPQLVDLSSAQMHVLHSWVDALEMYGIQGELFGETSFLLRSVPGGLVNVDPEKLLLEILGLLAVNGDPYESRKSVAVTLACHSSVRAGDMLTREEMSELVRQLELVESPHTCPHGRPTMLYMSGSQLERQFGRK